jgi:hypothetical protein
MDEAAAEIARLRAALAERVAESIKSVNAFERRRPARIVKMGEDITETLEIIPRQWKVIQTVREKFTCRDCEKISQPAIHYALVLALEKYLDGLRPKLRLKLAAKALTLW